MPRSDAGVPPYGMGFAAAIGGVALICVAIRAAAAANDLWLDEIWTVLQVAPLTSPLEILTRLREVNHPLYTLWVYALGAETRPLLLRLPSLLAGVAMLPIAAALARAQAELAGEAGRVRAAGVFALLLVGFSFLEVHYASEARGYALSVALSLLAGLAIFRGFEDNDARWRATYAGALCLALAAHPIAVHLLAAGASWSVVRLWRRDSGTAATLRSLLGWHGIPGVFLALFYALYLAKLTTVGGPVRSPFDVTGRVAVYALGLPDALPNAVALAAAALALALAGIAMARSRGDLWVFYAVGIVASPVALTWLRDVPFVFERYYLLSATLGLLLLADGLSRMWRRGPAAAVLVWLFVVGNAVHSADLLRHGRGDSLGLLALLASETSGARIRYSADHEFRIPTVLDFHARTALPGRKLVLVPADTGPEWLLFHRIGGKQGPDHDRLLVAGRVYRHRETFPSAPLSGWSAFVYRRESDDRGGE